MHDRVFPAAQARRMQRLLGLGGALCYHRDADGTTSAALLARAFPGLELHALESPALEPGLAKKLRSRKPKLVAFVDLAIDQDAKALAALRKATGCRMLVIDHHPVRRDLNSAGVLHFNSHFATKAYLPAAYLVWRLLRAMGRPAPAWIAAIGTYADYGRESPDVIAAAAREGASWDDIVAGAELVSSAITAKGSEGARKALHALVRAKGYAEFARNEQLGKWRDAVSAELKRVLADFAQRKEARDGMIAYELSSKYNLVSPVSTIASERFPHAVVIIRKHGKQGWKLSLRSQDGHADVGALAAAASKGIGRGGGHAKAAGALVSDWERFEKRFRSLLKKLE